MLQTTLRKDFQENALPLATPSFVGEGNSLVRIPLQLDNETEANFTLTTVSPFRVLTAQEEQFCMQSAQYCTARLIMDVFIIGPMCLAGIIGNLLAFVVLRLDHSNKTVTFLLMALAVADNGYLVCSLLLHTLKSAVECSGLNLGLAHLYPYLEVYLWPLASIAQTITIWFTVLVTADRYYAICRPFESMRHHVNTRAKRAVYIIVFLSVLYNVPRFFEQVVMYLPDHCKKSFRYIARHSSLRKNHIYKLIYKTILFFIFRMIIPMTVLVVLNIKLIQALRRAKKDHAQLTQATATQKTNYYFNLILVTIVSVFIVCQAPDFVVRILVTISAYSKHRFNLHWVNLFTNMLLTLNSSVNCVLYCLTGRKFRQILCRILSRPCTRQFSPMDDVRYGNSEFSINRGGTTLSNVHETNL